MMKAMMTMMIMSGVQPCL